MKFAGWIEYSMIWRVSHRERLSSSRSFITGHTTLSCKRQKWLSWQQQRSCRSVSLLLFFFVTSAMVNPLLSTAMIYRQRPCRCVCLRTVNLKAENTSKRWYLLVLRKVLYKWCCVSNAAIWCCGMMFWRCWDGCYIDCHCDMQLRYYAVISGGLQ